MGCNLAVALRRQAGCEVIGFDVRQKLDQLPGLVARADLVFHLAGVNRPREEREFTAGNADLTRLLCQSLHEAGRKAPLVLSSTTQAELDNPYGRSKKAAEEAVLEYYR